MVMFSGLKVTRVSRQAQSRECVRAFRLKGYCLVGSFMGQKSVLISGAGIAGPTLAYWLRHRGFEPVLIERAPHFRKGGYMIDFWGIGFDVAERMNLIPQLRDIGYLIDCVKFVNERGRREERIRRRNSSKRAS